MGVRKFVAIIGGADPEHPLESQNKPRHLAVGSLVLAIASWAFIAGLLAFHSNFHGPWIVAIIAAFILASIVFLFDVIITVVSLKSGRFWSRVGVIGIRALLSIGVGLVVSHATILFIYRDDINSLVSQSDQATVAQITKYTEAHSDSTKVINDATKQINQDNDAIKSDESTVHGYEAELNTLYQNWQADAVCVDGNRAANGDICGPGPSTRVLEQAYDTYRDSTLPKARQPLDADAGKRHAEITQLRGTVKGAQRNLSVEIAHATADANNDRGLQAQNNALLHLLTTDWTAWIWPIFFILIDIAVAFVKAVLPESDYDRRRRLQAELKTKIDTVLTESGAGAEELKKLLQHAAVRQAEVAKEGIDHDARRRLDALRGQGPAPSWHQRLGRLRDVLEQVHLPRRRRIVYAAGVVLTVLLVLAGVFSSSPSLGSSPLPGSTATLPGSTPEGHTTVLRDGMTLIVPAAAVSDDDPVSPTYPDTNSWADHTAASPAVRLSTSGQVNGQPTLLFAVPAALRQQAAAGDLQAAYASNDPSGWTEAETSYNGADHIEAVSVPQLGTWRFWTWNWSEVAKSTTHSLDRLIGQRAPTGANCDSGLQPPAWYSGSAGVDNDPAVIVRSCVQGHAGDDTLDVEIVNNRPYGLILRYDTAPIVYGRHDPANTLPDMLRDVIGDASVAHGRGLYLPPLSQASLGIENIGDAATDAFTVEPTAATVTADMADALGGLLIDKAAEGASERLESNALAAAATSSCSDAVTDASGALPSLTTIYTWLTGFGLKCLKDILAVAGSGELKQGVNPSTLSTFTSWVGKFNALVDGGWTAVIDIIRLVGKLGNVLDFIVDQATATVPGLGFGFTVTAHHGGIGTTSSGAAPLGAPPAIRR